MSMYELREEARVVHNAQPHGLYTTSLATMLFEAAHAPDKRLYFTVTPFPNKVVVCWIEDTGDRFPKIGCAEGWWQHFDREAGELRFAFALGRVIQRKFDLEERNASAST